LFWAFLSFFLGGLKAAHGLVVFAAGGAL
jgi:hypothetical protein